MNQVELRPTSMANLDYWTSTDFDSDEEEIKFIDAMLFDVHTHFVEDPDLRKKGRKNRTDNQRNQPHDCSHSFHPSSEFDLVKCSKQLEKIKIQNFCLMGTEPWNWNDIKMVCVFML